MSGTSGVGTELSKARASARRRVKVSAVSDTCGDSASASRNSGSTLSIVLMVGSQVRLGQRKRYGSDCLATSQCGFRISIATAGHRVRPSAGNHPWWTRQAYPLPATLTTYQASERMAAQPVGLHVRGSNLSLDDLLRLVIKPLHVTLGGLIGC